MAAAVFALLAIVIGALDPKFAAIHEGFGIAAVAAAVIGAFRNRVAWVAVAIGTAGCLLRGEIVHACIAPVFFTACVATAQWQPVSFRASPFTVLVVKSAPALVLCQIVLGAAYRHKAIGVMPHMAGALMVAGLLLAIGTVILQRASQPPLLRTAAGALLGIVLLQVSLGITVFVMRLLDVDTVPAFRPLAAAHITVGALTLAASTVPALRVTAGRTPSSSWRGFS